MEVQGGGTLSYKRFDSNKFPIEVVASVIEGEADDAVAEDLATNCVDYLMSATRNASLCRKMTSDAECIEEVFRHAEFVRVWCRAAVGFLNRYPNARHRLECAVEVAFFAETGLIFAGYNVGEQDRKSEVRVKTYIIQNEHTGLIKIGRSVSPASRIRTLETSAGAPLKVIAIFDADIESELHQRFKDIRGIGEWFSDDGRINAWVVERLTSEGVVA